jgi:uncharacterized membrane protein YraQ (UPF0718 family)
MYGTVPLIAALGRKGLPQYVLAAFMVSSILLNPNLLLFSFALGVPIVLFRLFSCIAAGFTAGILAKIFFKDRNLFDFKSFAEHQCKYNEKKRFFKDIHKSITITAPYLLIGIVGTALFDRYVPKEAVVTLFGQNRRFGVLLAASLGVPVYVCGGGTIPLLKLWLHQGMTPGSAIAFMLTGPATKLTNLSAVKTILGTFNFIIYILFNFIFSICMGFLANILIGGL